MQQRNFERSAGYMQNSAHDVKKAIQTKQRKHEKKWRKIVMRKYEATEEKKWEDYPLFPFFT